MMIMGDSTLGRIMNVPQGPPIYVLEISLCLLAVACPDGGFRIEVAWEGRR